MLLNHSMFNIPFMKKFHHPKGWWTTNRTVCCWRKLVQSKKLSYHYNHPDYIQSCKSFFLGFQKNVFNKSRWEKARVGWFDLRWFEIIAMKHVYYHMWNRWPTQVRCMKQPVRWEKPEGWDAEGGGRGAQDGEHWFPMADSCECMAKTSTL